MNEINAINVINAIICINVSSVEIGLLVGDRSSSLPLWLLTALIADQCHRFHCFSRVLKAEELVILVSTEDYEQPRRTTRSPTSPY